VAPPLGLEGPSSYSGGPKPVISVIVSTRNRAHYLPEVLQTLAAQECDAPFEVIVIDNGSTDSTAALIEDWCRRDSRFRTAFEPRPGLSRGKNAGIRLARAPLLVFTDDDMRVPPCWVESYRRLFAGHEGELMLAGGPVVPVPHDLGTWPDWLDEAALADVGLLHHRSERALVKFEYVWGGNLAAPKLVFDRLGLWDETAGLQADQRVTREDSRFYEDTELQDRVRAAGGSTWFCPEAGVYHRVERGSVTPRRVSSTAFARGRNDFWQQGLRVWDRVELVPSRNALACVLVLGESLVRWGFWLVLFRFWQKKGLFERARGAAFMSGRSLDSLRAGRKSMRLFQRAGRIAFPVRNLLVRLTPDVG
jgi:glycosyltransferase involved in cell wall biosynthesis